MAERNSLEGRLYREITIDIDNQAERTDLKHCSTGERDRATRLGINEANFGLLLAPCHDGCDAAEGFLARVSAKEANDDPLKRWKSIINDLKDNKRRFYVNIHSGITKRDKCDVCKSIGNTSTKTKFRQYCGNRPVGCAVTLAFLNHPRQSVGSTWRMVDASCADCVELTEGGDGLEKLKTELREHAKTGGWRWKQVPVDANLENKYEVKSADLIAALRDGRSTFTRDEYVRWGVGDRLKSGWSFARLAGDTVHKTVHKAFKHAADVTPSPNLSVAPNNFVRIVDGGVERIYQVLPEMRHQCQKDVRYVFDADMVELMKARLQLSAETHDLS